MTLFLENDELKSQNLCLVLKDVLDFKYKNQKIIVDFPDDRKEYNNYHVIGGIHDSLNYDEVITNKYLLKSK